MAQTPGPAQQYNPQIDKSVDPKVTRHLQMIYQALNNHNAAIVKVNSKVTGTSTTSTSSKGTTNVTENVNKIGVSSFNTLSGDVSYFPSLGFVNAQSGTSYTTQTNDNGALILLNNAAPIAVTLNFNVFPPWFTTLSNEGTGLATITPSQGTINGLASITLPGGAFVTIFFDGLNWWADSPGSSAGGVTKIVAGSNVTISPVSGIGVVTVNAFGSGTSTADHFVGSGGTPTIMAGVDTGIGASASITGHDASGTLQVTMGTGTTSSGGFSSIAVVTYAVPYAAVATVVLFPAIGNAAILSGVYVIASPGSFEVRSVAIPVALDPYIWNYLVIGT